jgi:hypothetical protein
MSAGARPAVIHDAAWECGPDEIVVGVDILELVSSSMYVEPLTAYREYVQNAADGIDEARERGFDAGRIDITIDPSGRTVRIRDDGTGLSRAAFVRRLTAFGASEKRHRQRRGFRGVGRLAGLGYCQELIFRSQADGERVISELRWDGRLLRSILRAANFTGTLAEAVRRATSHRRYVAEGTDRFFEVELRGIVRHGRDDLLNDAAVALYLAQVAPIAFSPSFSHAVPLNAFLLDKGIRADVEIYINGGGPLYRPHRDAIQMKQGLASAVASPEFIEIPALDGSPVACGWVLHHDYLGAIPRAEGVRGLRLRSGNIQVGDDDILVDLFPEPRFNAWAVAELHILDRRIVPNGRRDHYEQSTHFGNVVNYLAPIARAVALRCRTNSQHRQLLRKAKFLAERVSRDVAILKQGAITKVARARCLADIETTLRRIERIARAPSLSVEERADLKRRYRRLSAQIGRVAAQDRRATQLEHLPATRRRAYEEVFSLIYACASDARLVSDLVQRVLARLE